MQLKELIGEEIKKELKTKTQNVVPDIFEVHPDKKASEFISEFLKFIRGSVSVYNNYMADLNVANDKTCDIMHSLELDENLTYHEQAHLARKLKEVRKERRIAKDGLSIFEILYNFMQEQSTIDFLKKLDKLIGDVRKEEKYLQNRTYNVKYLSVEKENLEDIEKRKENIL